MKKLILFSVLLLSTTVYASPLKLELDGGSGIKKLFSTYEDNFDFNDIVKAQVKKKVSKNAVTIIQEGMLDTPTPDILVEYGADASDNFLPTGTVEGTVTFLDHSKAPHDLKIACIFQSVHPGNPSQWKLCAIRFGNKIANYLNSQLD